MSSKIILIFGLPGAGKTTLARALAPLISAVHFNGDEVRAHLNSDLGFTLEDRLQQAARMGWLCGRVAKAGHYAIADFVCPTTQTRDAFGPSFSVFVDRIQRSRFEDTNQIFERPASCNVVVSDEDPASVWAQRIKKEILGKHW
jgi:adenylylsulfate kinase